MLDCTSLKSQVAVALWSGTLRPLSFLNYNTGRRTASCLSYGWMYVDM